LIQLQRDFSYTIYNNGLIEKTDLVNNETFYYSKRWNQYLTRSSFCIEEYYCTSCLRDKKLTKGYNNFDSLVVCKEHYKDALKINYHLKAAIMIPDKEKYEETKNEIDAIIDKMEIS
jgi:hypothetical protein